jgi:LEA14-like dessication related protein
MTMNATLRAGFVAVALLLLAGCSAFGPKIEAPKLTLLNVGMTSADIFSQQFLVKMHVQNPNDRELPIKGIDYKLFLGGDSFADGMSNAPFTVPALGETDFEMTVRTNFISSLGRLVSRLNGATKIEYTFEGKVFTNVGVVRKIPFQQTGVVDLTFKR